MARMPKIRQFAVTVSSPSLPTESYEAVKRYSEAHNLPLLGGPRLRITVEEIHA